MEVRRFWSKTEFYVLHVFQSITLKTTLGFEFDYDAWEKREKQDGEKQMRKQIKKSIGPRSAGQKYFGTKVCLQWRAFQC